MSARRRALAWPDLRPYIHPGPLARAWAVGSVITLRRIGRYWAAGENPSAWCCRGLGVVSAAGCSVTAAVTYPASAPAILIGAWSLLAIAQGATPTPSASAPAPADGDTPEAFADDPDPGPEQPAEEQLLLVLLRELIGDDTGVHLQELYPAMRERLPGLADAPDSALRQVLADHQVRVDRTVRSRGVAGRSGVRPDGLPSPATPGPLSGPLSANGDAGQSVSGEQAESERRAAGEPLPDSVTITPDTARRYYRVTR